MTEASTLHRAPEMVAERTPVLAVIQCAMDIEAAPFLDRLSDKTASMIIGGGGDPAVSGGSAQGDKSGARTSSARNRSRTEAENSTEKANSPSLSGAFEDLESPEKLENLETKNGRQTFTLGTWNDRPVLIVTSGIGLANAASATARALMMVKPDVVIAAGTAGGLAASVNVGDVVISTSAVFNAADATAFGYARGQVPGMPPMYEVSAAVSASAKRVLTAHQARAGLSGLADENGSADDSDRGVESRLTGVDGSQSDSNVANERPSLSVLAGESGMTDGSRLAGDANAALEAEQAGADQYPVLMGQAISGDAFVTAKNVGTMREDFPQALTTDMETAALAQVAWSSGVDWVMIRAVSDLCGPTADQDFHMDAATAAQHSCDVVEAFLTFRH